MAKVLPTGCLILFCLLFSNLNINVAMAQNVTSTPNEVGNGTSPPQQNVNGSTADWRQMLTAAKCADVSQPTNAQLHTNLTAFMCYCMFGGLCDQIRNKDAALKGVSCDYICSLTWTYYRSQNRSQQSPNTVAPSVGQSVEPGLSVAPSFGPSAPSGKSLAPSGESTVAPPEHGPSKPTVPKPIRINPVQTEEPLFSGIENSFGSGFGKTFGNSFGNSFMNEPGDDGPLQVSANQLYPSRMNLTQSANNSAANQVAHADTLGDSDSPEPNVLSSAVDSSKPRSNQQTNSNKQSNSEPDFIVLPSITTTGSPNDNQKATISLRLIGGGMQGRTSGMNQTGVRPAGVDRSPHQKAAVLAQQQQSKRKKKHRKKKKDKKSTSVAILAIDRGGATSESTVDSTRIEQLNNETKSEQSTIETTKSEQSNETTKSEQSSEALSAQPQKFAVSVGMSQASSESSGTEQSSQGNTEASEKKSTSKHKIKNFIQEYLGSLLSSTGTEEMTVVTEVGGSSESGSKSGGTQSEEMTVVTELVASSPSEIVASAVYEYVTSQPPSSSQRHVPNPYQTVMPSDPAERRTDRFLTEDYAEEIFDSATSSRPGSSENPEVSQEEFKQLQVKI